MNLPPKEGVGNAGCPRHPQPRVRLALVKMHTSKRVPRNHPAFPHAMVLTVSFVLPGDRALLPPSPHGYPAHPNPVGRLHLRKT